MVTLNFSKITNIEFDGIDRKDHPDYCDAFISYAEYEGRELTEEELEEVNEDSMFVHEKLFNYLF